MAHGRSWPCSSDGQRVLRSFEERAERGGRVARDAAYGPHTAQAIDLFQPERWASTLCPALLFVHGGACVDGSRNRSDEVYANMLYCFARHGVVGANIGYRLASEARFPKATHDIAAAVAWIHKNAQAYGIDPARVFLMGRSTGGAHVASYAYDRCPRRALGTGLAGLIIVSGRVRADALPENPNARKVEAYYGTDASHFDDFSSLPHVDADSRPTLVTWSEFENPLTDAYCAELAYRFAFAKRRTPPVVWPPKHNHTSAIAHLNTGDTALETDICSVIFAPY